MKHMYVFILLACSTFCSSLYAKNIQECKISNDTLVKINSVHSVDGGVSFRLIINGVEGSAFPVASYQGFPEPVSIVMSKCIRGVFVFVINYGPPYQVGFLLREYKSNIQRIDFSEKEIPVYIFQNKDEVGIVIPNLGNEVEGEHIIYKYKNSLIEYKGSDLLPDAKFYSYIKLAP